MINTVMVVYRVHPAGFAVLRPCLSGCVLTSVPAPRQAHRSKSLFLRVTQVPGATGRHWLRTESGTLRKGLQPMPVQGLLSHLIPGRLKKRQEGVAETGPRSPARKCRWTCQPALSVTCPLFCLPSCCRVCRLSHPCRASLPSRALPSRHGGWLPGLFWLGCSAFLWPFSPPFFNCHQPQSLPRHSFPYCRY